MKKISIEVRRTLPGAPYESATEAVLVELSLDEDLRGEEITLIKGLHEYDAYLGLMGSFRAKGFLSEARYQLEIESYKNLSARRFRRLIMKLLAREDLLERIERTQLGVYGWDFLQELVADIQALMAYQKEREEKDKEKGETNEK